jgi:hypothetical protein
MHVRGVCITSCFVRRVESALRLPLRLQSIGHNVFTGTLKYVFDLRLRTRPENVDVCTLFDGLALASRSLDHLLLKDCTENLMQFNDSNA